MSEHISPRVNSARLADYNGRIVRMTGKVLRVNDASKEAIVQASDGGEVKVALSGMNNMSTPSTFVEVIGKVTANDELRAHATIDLGEDIDMCIVDFVVEKMHDPKFSHMV